MNAFRLDGEVALVTGGGTGLGLATARRMAEAGAKVVIVGRREEPLKAAVGGTGGIQYVVHDVSELDRAGELVGKVSAVAGKAPTILVNNAGNHLKKWAVDTSVEEFQRVISTHVMGSFAMTHAVVPGMIEAGRGSVVFIASMASLFGIPQLIAYSAAKSAYVGMVRTLATEISPRGVRVNAIAPGWIESDMVKGAFAGDPKRAEKILGRTPLGRLGEGDDVAYAAVYLCSPAAKFLTGTTLVVDGGISIGF